MLYSFNLHRNTSTAQSATDSGICFKHHYLLNLSQVEPVLPVTEETMKQQQDSYSLLLPPGYFKQTFLGICYWSERWLAGFCFDPVRFLQIAQLNCFRLQETVHHQIYSINIVQGSMPYPRDSVSSNSATFWEYCPVLNKYYLILPLSTVVDLTVVSLP